MDRRRKYTARELFGLIENGILDRFDSEEEQDDQILDQGGDNPDYPDSTLPSPAGDMPDTNDHEQASPSTTNEDSSSTTNRPVSSGDNSERLDSEEEQDDQIMDPDYSPYSSESDDSPDSQVSVKKLKKVSNPENERFKSALPSTSRNIPSSRGDKSVTNPDYPDSTLPSSAGDMPDRNIHEQASSSTAKEDSSSTTNRPAIAVPPDIGIRQTSTKDRPDPIDVDRFPVQSPPKKSRKRPIKPEQWKRNRIKSKRARGEAYVSWSGKQVPAKTTGPDCKCKRQCYNVIEEDERHQILSEFLDIGNKNMQDHHLYNLIGRTKVHRRRERTGTGKRRIVNFIYHVNRPGKPDVQVCKEAFKSIHAISKKRLRRLQMFDTSTSPSDKRGRHPNSQRTPDEVVSKIKAHIESFPKQESHYSRKDNPHKEYLDPALNVQRMWLLYVEKEEPDQLANIAEGKFSGIVKLWLYRKIFNTSYNLSFGYPRSDTCSTCDEIDKKIIASATEQETRNLLVEKELHLRKAEKGYQSRRKDSKEAILSWKGKERNQQTDDCSTDAFNVITFDFQQNLPTPTLTTSDVFYRRQLWVYSFGIHDCVNGKASIYLWPENRANRGVDEVASCLVDYLETHSYGAKKLIFYSDGCAGQNINKFLMAVFMRLCAQKKFVSIEHKFPEKGHSRLPNDQDFSHIEKRKKRDKALVPEDWTRIVEKARMVQPYEVVDFQQDKIHNYKQLADQSFKTSFKDDSDAKVLTSTLKWISYGSSTEFDFQTETYKEVSHPSEIWMRKSLNPMEPWMKVNPLKKNSNLRYLTKDTKRKYTGQIPLKVAKVTDLQFLADKYLTGTHALYYRSLSVVSDEHTISDNDDV